jgi:FkbM family methyltransferase
MKIDFDFVTHQYGDYPVTFALNRAAKDSYTQGLRKSPYEQRFCRYIMRRASRLTRQIKVADFGANIGVVSLPLAAHGASVLAVEAMPANFAALMTATRRNNFRNLLPVQLAAMSEVGVLALHGISAWASADLEGKNPSAACDTLVNILTTYGFEDADIIKIDIEGAELPALNGANAFFDHRPDTEVIFESNNHTCRLFGYDRQDLLCWFLERGFSTYMIEPEGLMPIGAMDPQPRPVVDILATKRQRSVLQQEGEKIVAMTDEYIAQTLLRMATDPNTHVRQHAATEIGRVADSVKETKYWPQIVSACS